MLFDMHIVISQTNHLVHKQSILVDVGTFENIEAWITALINKKTVFEPINATISFNHSVYDIIKDGEIASNLNFLLKKIRRLPSDITHFPNDKSVIKADSFAHTLHFSLDGESDAEPDKPVSKERSMAIRLPAEPHDDRYSDTV